MQVNWGNGNIPLKVALKSEQNDDDNRRQWLVLCIDSYDYKCNLIYGFSKLVSACQQFTVQSDSIATNITTAACAATVVFADRLHLYQ